MWCQGRSVWRLTLSLGLGLLFLRLYKVLPPLFAAHRTLLAAPPYCRHQFPTLIRYVFTPGFPCGSELAVYVISEAGESDLREAIRRTWGRTLVEDSGNSSLFFVIGVPVDQSVQRKVMEEAILARDVLQPHICEGYERLSIKVQALLSWHSEHCPRTRFLLKQDSDTFLLVNNLRGFLRGLDQQSTNGIWCLVSPRTEVPRELMSRSAFLQKYLPPYCSGHAYLMSGGVAGILASAVHAMTFVGIEDVVFTGLLPQELGIDRRHSTLFLGVFAADLNCNSPRYITIHNVRDVRGLKKIWQRYLTAVNCSVNSSF